mgnify:FL=1
MQRKILIAKRPTILALEAILKGITSWQERGQTCLTRNSMLSMISFTFLEKVLEDLALRMQNLAGSELLLGSLEE